MKLDVEIKTNMITVNGAFISSKYNKMNNITVYFSLYVI